MAEKFRNKYRVPSARLLNWNYGSNGAYFITICCKKMHHFFGEVIDKKMILNSAGVLAQNIWIEIPTQFPYIELGNFQIMPNHLHGILIINKSITAVQTRFIASHLDDSDGNKNQFIASHLDDSDGNKNQFIASHVDYSDGDKNQFIASHLDDSDGNKNQFIASHLDHVDHSEMRLIASSPVDKDGIGGFSGENNPMLANNISRIVRWYKGRCTFEMRKINSNFEWHPRFHDHIIRNSESFERIQTYIEENPERWEQDKFHKK